MAGERGTGWFERTAREIEEAFVLPKGRGKLVRPRYPRRIAGVCSGLAEYFGWNLAGVRVMFVVCSVASSGLIAVLYAVLWVVIPEGSFELTENAGTTAS